MAHLDLEMYGEAVSETRKTHDFLNGIHDPKAMAMKLIPGWNGESYHRRSMTK